jgi:hypothetical protein
MITLRLENNWQDISFSSNRKALTHSLRGCHGSECREISQWGAWFYLARPDRLAARLLAVDPDAKPRHFGDVMLTGKLRSNWKWKTNNNIIGLNKPQWTSVESQTMLFNRVSIGLLVKIDLKTYCNWNKSFAFLLIWQCGTETMEVSFETSWGREIKGRKSWDS